MKALILPMAVAAAYLFAGPANAEPYVDYMPQKGVWHVQTIRVDPNHIDDYVTALKKEWVIGEEISKKHGLIDYYGVKIKMNAADGKGNVLLLEHYPNMSLLEMDQARDQAILKENYAATPKATSDEKVKEFDKYRTFVGDDYWNDIEYTK